eukprot:765773-Hanusia_phi.AAC.2
MREAERRGGACSDAVCSGDISGARDVLFDEIAQFAHYRGCQCTIVYDAVGYTAGLPITQVRRISFRTRTRMRSRSRSRRGEDEDEDEVGEEGMRLEQAEMTRAGVEVVYVRDESADT